MRQLQNPAFPKGRVFLLRFKEDEARDRPPGTENRFIPRSLAPVSPPPSVHVRGRRSSRRHSRFLPTVESFVQSRPSSSAPKPRSWHATSAQESITVIPL